MVATETVLWPATHGWPFYPQLGTGGTSARLPLQWACFPPRVHFQWLEDAGGQSCRRCCEQGLWGPAQGWPMQQGGRPGRLLSSALSLRFSSLPLGLNLESHRSEPPENTTRKHVLLPCEALSHTLL